MSARMSGSDIRFRACMMNKHAARIPPPPVPGRRAAENRSSVANGERGCCVEATPVRPITRPRGLEPLTCGFGAIQSFRSGPDHLFTLSPSWGSGCRALRSAHDPPTRAGVLPGRLTRWSLHLPSATWATGKPVSHGPANGSARDYPAEPISAVGFPEFTRFASVRSGEFGSPPDRAPLCRRKPPLYPTELRAQLMKESKAPRVGTLPTPKESPAFAGLWRKPELECWISDDGGGGRPHRPRPGRPSSREREQPRSRRCRCPRARRRCHWAGS